MVAAQPATSQLSVARDGDGRIIKNWNITPEYLQSTRQALEDMIAAFGGRVLSWQEQPDWQKDVHSAAHYSGTCRMAADSRSGVCDTNLKVFGTKNLFVCDGSVLPAVGYSNTGLTLGALALRLAEHVKSQSS